MEKLSTHVLDTMHGGPAVGMAYEFFRVSDGAATLLSAGTTNADGRTDKPLLGAGEVKRGTYRLRFHVSAYFRAKGVQLPEPTFLDWVTLDFGVSEEGGSYHVPLVCSPWTYSTYRGS
jgi:5-hydroxyisourate hydrolase